MFVFKVANSRDYRVRGEEGEREKIHEGVEEEFSGYTRSREMSAMSAMVTALTYVVTGRRAAKSPEGGESGNKKTNGVRIAIPLQDILQTEGQCNDSAKNLNVSQSALKHKLLSQSHPNETPAVVDQEGIQQLNSNTLPSDQALVTPVDTNSVVAMEILPLQFSPTAQQENPDEDFTKDGQVNFGCVGKGERKEKTPGGDRGKKKTIGVGISIPLEDILQPKGMSLKDAAKHLNVMMSALWPRPEGDGLEPRGSFPLARQSSISSMTFDELQDAMNELLGNIWTAEETRSMVSACGSAQGGAPSENINLQQEGSLTLPCPTSQKTVDEVWKDMSKEYGDGGGDKDGRCNSGSYLLQRQPSLREMTLEDFLVRAGVVREDAQPETKTLGGGRRNKRTTGFRIAATSEDSSQVQGMTVEETQAMASVCGSAQGGVPSENINLQRKGSLTLPCPTTQKTVDEVWKDMSKEYGDGGGDKDGRCNSGSYLLQRQPSLREMTLEDFLVRAGVVREDAQPETKTLGGGRRNKRTTGFRIAATSEDSSQVQGMTVEETQAMASVCGSAQGGVPSENFNLQRQGSLTFPRFLSLRTVDEVWKDLTKESGGGGDKDGSGISGSHLHQRTHTFGEMASVCGSAQGGVPSENFNLQRQGSLTLPRFLSLRTVDEVWKDLTKESGGGGGDKDGSGISGSHLHQRTHTFGEMALEDSDKENEKPNPVEIGGVGTGEGEMEGGLSNSGCSGKRKRKEKTRGGGERGNKKTTGVRIAINLEDISEVQGMTVEHAARHLKVSRSTLKRVCRKHGIERWPPRKGHELSSQSRPNKSPVVVDQELISQLNSDMLLPSNQVSATRNTNSVSVKARYGKETIKFQLSWPWGMVELKQQVEKRLELKDETYVIRYKDEANEMILIACDEDLQDCISSSSHPIEVFLEPK